MKSMHDELITRIECTLWHDELQEATIKELVRYSKFLEDRINLIELRLSKLISNIDNK